MYRGIVTWKQLGHDSYDSLNSHWLRVQWAHTLGLLKGGFGVQPITSSIEFHMTSIDNVGWDYMDFFLKQFLKVNLVEFAMGTWNYTKCLSPLKDFGLHSKNSSTISSKKRGTMVIWEPWLNAFGVNMP